MHKVMGAWAIHTARFSTQQRDCLLWGSSDAHSRVMTSGHDQHLHAKAARQSVICTPHVDPACLHASSNRAVYKGPQKASCGPEFNNLSIYLYTNTCCFPMEVLYISVYIYIHIQIDTYTHIYIPSLHTAFSVSFCGCTSAYTGRFTKPFAKLVLSPTI